MEMHEMRYFRILIFFHQENGVSLRCKVERSGRSTYFLAICANEYE